MPSAEPAVAVLLGGGVESTTLVRRFLAAGRRVVPVHVHCGLIWDDCESGYVRRFCAASASPSLDQLIEIRLPLDDFLKGHWAVTGTGVPRAKAPSAELEIPLRNLTLLAFALHRITQLPTPRASRAANNKARGLHRFALALGTTADNSYSDGSRDYFDKCEGILRLEAGRPVHILTPLIGMTKADVIRSSDRATLDLSFSCVDPQFDLHCGRCIKCGRRKEAFRQAGVSDPTRYAH
jgi:7-cyano-7-deazaguanine synthase